jgi:hypothetical protein
MHRFWLLLLCASTALAQQPTSPAPPDATTIMSRVAANQDRSDSERAHYVYTQHARVASRKGKTIRCEEITDIRVTPTPTGSHRQVLKLDGRLLVKGKYISYTQMPDDKPASKSAKKSDPSAKSDSDSEDLSVTLGDDSMDRDLVENMRDNLTNRKSRDGIGAGLFPLISKTQADYLFHLAGQEHLNGHDVFHITFEPKDKSDYLWKGDAYIDTTAYQPVLVRTTMSRKIPFAVRTLLGTSLPGLGFTVIYAEQPGGIWFPVSFGTEFKMHILFFLNREITVSAENRDFEKTHVSATIVPTENPSEPSEPHQP